MILHPEPGRDAAQAASLLRHDLITPINHILGYCDLLVEDAEEKGRVYRSRSLQLVRTLGKQALASIDRVLIRAVQGDRPVDVSALGRELLGPSAAIVEACHALEDASSQVPDRAGFVDDLARIRDAAARLVDMAGQMNEATVATSR